MKTIITHVFILLAVSFCSIAVSAAGNNDKKLKIEKPDMDKICAEVNNPASKYYYPKLIATYEKRDTTMQLEDFRHLYYGYACQEDYDPYRKSEFSQKVEELYQINKHTRAECDTIIKYAELSLKDTPFDLQQMNFLIYALREKKKHHLANIWQYKLNHILEAIVSSGTGLDQENAWHVIIPRNEYNIINFMGYKAISQEFERPYYDHVFIEKKKDKSPEGYYFNIEYILKEYNRKNPE